MATTLKEVNLQIQLEAAGKNLLGFSSVASTTPIELLRFLDRVEGLLSEVGQAPSRWMKDALEPTMKALVSDQLLKHSDFYVRVAVASCMSELIRITAPDTPYNDTVQMKDVFNLIVLVLGLLSSEDARRYDKGLRILSNMTNVRAAVLMVDNLIPKMFRVFLNSIRYPHSVVVFRQMESIMTRALEESEEISNELLSILLTSVNRKIEHVSCSQRLLGEFVLINCSVKLRYYLPKFVRSGNLNVDDYSSVVAHICQCAPENKHACGLCLSFYLQIFIQD
ncbi:sister chromatid cohesion protein PDS5 homolog C-like [Apium graveolens]|uniref:sister chromatid cohesion protein PDS5 homolog C-like n=1 Tax=Apium graveolens TaxID=4045 RepID=UPI003D7BAF50